MLPTKKTSASPVRNSILLLHSFTGGGKSTFLNSICLNGEKEKGELLHLDFHEGHQTEGLEGFKTVIDSWADLEQIYFELAQGKHPYQFIGLDQIDGMYRLAARYVLESSGRDPNEHLAHVDDIGYKANDLVADEVLQMILKMKRLPMIKCVFVTAQSNLKTITSTYQYDKFFPIMHWSLGNMLKPYCKGIFFGTIKETESGKQHVWKTQQSLYWEARPLKGFDLPDEIPMDWNEFRKQVGL